MNKYTIKARGPIQDFYEIIIPAAGIGKRMKTYGPKTLISINGTTIIDNQLRIINRIFRNYRVVLVCGFQAEKLMNSTPEEIIKVENPNFEDTNVVRSIGVGLRATVSQHVLIVYGDLVFNNNALNAKFDESCLILDQSQSMSNEEVGCITNNNIVESLCYDLPQKWGQIVYLQGKELTLMKQYCYNRVFGKTFGFEAINEVINMGGVFKSIAPKNSYIIDVDTSKDIEKARNLL
jgi:choline kinase